MSTVIQGNAQTVIAETAEQELARLRAENQSLKANANKPKRPTFPIGNGLSVAVSEKGAVSIYGMGRMPITLYRSQLERLSPCWAQLLAFVSANADKLATKPVAVK